MASPAVETEHTFQAEDSVHDAPPMCGIAALIGLAPRDAALVPALTRMTAIVRHRGPDDEGYVLFANEGACALGGNDTPSAVFASGLPYAATAPIQASGLRCRVALGHRRLSILDLSAAGHQPMCTEDGRFWIVFNGEIYNQAPLRSELEASGEAFLSRSDTEVILKAYRRWRADCLSRLRGMFAFVIYDRVEDRVFVARDRFGIKPLYYWFSPQGFLAFASEIKQFTVLPGWRPTVNGQRAYDYLAWDLLDHTDQTLFAGVQQVRGGEYAEVRVQDLTRVLPVTRWYRLVPELFEGSFEEAAGRFGRLLRDSVAEHLQSDVPVGSCLSGGLDSSSIVCLLSDIRRASRDSAPQKTFSACALEKQFDEREFVEEVVRATGVEAHFTYPAFESLFDTLDPLTWHQDEPFGSTSMYAQWCVFRLTAQHAVKVVLDGQGADEQLIGYHAFFPARFAGLLRSGRWKTLWREAKETERLHGLGSWGALARAVDLFMTRQPRSILRRWAGRTPGALLSLDMALLGAAPRDPYADAGDRADSVEARSLAQLTATSLPMLLHWEDRSSMAHSIESRVPFLDHRVVEFVLGLPVDFKLSGGVTKRVLREGMKGVLPERIRTRTDKMGFVTPEEIWLRERTPDGFRRALKRAVESSRGILAPSSLDKVERILAGREPFSFGLWRVISFGAWMERFEVNGGGPRVAAG